jgi:hypothetical protein
MLVEGSLHSLCIAHVKVRVTQRNAIVTARRKCGLEILTELPVCSRQQRSTSRLAHVPPSLV